jgi:methionine biosynthesis protein MetW
VRGRMPVGGSLPYDWYETPNIHLCTLRDFEALLGPLDLRVVTRLLLSAGGQPAPGRAGAIPNLLAAGAVYLIEPTEPTPR